MVCNTCSYNGFVLIMVTNYSKIFSFVHFIFLHYNG
jgi:hypothetical protein